MAGAGFGQNGYTGAALGPQDSHQPAIGGNLTSDRLGDGAHCALDHHQIERCALGIAVHQLARYRPDQLVRMAVRQVQQCRILLQCRHVHAAGGQDGRAVAAAAAHYQSRLAGARAGELDQPGQHQRLDQHPAAAQRDVVVDIGQASHCNGHVGLARQGPHGVQDAAVGHLGRAQLAVDHQIAGQGVVGGRHRRGV